MEDKNAEKHRHRPAPSASGAPNCPRLYDRRSPSWSTEPHRACCCGQRATSGRRVGCRLQGAPPCGVQPWPACQHGSNTPRGAGGTSNPSLRPTTRACHTEKNFVLCSTRSIKVQFCLFSEHFGWLRNVGWGDLPPMQMHSSHDCHGTCVGTWGQDHVGNAFMLPQPPEPTTPTETPRGGLGPGVSPSSACRCHLHGHPTPTSRGFYTRFMVGEVPQAQVWATGVGFGCLPRVQRGQK